MLLALLLISASTTSIGIPIDSLSVKQLLKRGDEHTKVYDIQGALPYYELAYKKEPEQFETLFKLIQTVNDLGEDYRDAGDQHHRESYFRRNLELTEKLYRLYPKKAQSPFTVAVARGNLALSLSPKEKVKLAKDVERLLKESIALDPEYPYAYLGLAIFYSEVANISFIEKFFANLFFGGIPEATFADSIHYFKISLEKKPQFAFTYYRMAEAYVRAKDFKNAYVAYQDVVNAPIQDHGDAFIKKRALERMAELEKKHGKDALIAEKKDSSSN